MKVVSELFAWMKVSRLNCQEKSFYRLDDWVIDNLPFQTFYFNFLLFSSIFNLTFLTINRVLYRACVYIHMANIPYDKNMSWIEILALVNSRYVSYVRGKAKVIRKLHQFLVPDFLEFVDKAVARDSGLNSPDDRSSLRDKLIRDYSLISRE